MKTNWMTTKLAMAFDNPAGDAGGAGGSGGGAAVADAPGAGAGAGGAGSGASSGGGSDFGFMRSLPTRDLSPKPDAIQTKTPDGKAKSEAAAAAGDTHGFDVVGDDGKVLKSFKTKEEAEAFAENPVIEDPAADTGEAKTFEVKDDDGKVLAAFETKEEAEAYVESNKTDDGDTPFKTPIFKRFKTRNETEAAFGRAESELVRLSNENKTLKASAKLEIEKGLATRDSELASLKAELEIARKTPPFQTLSDEQEDALGKESPAKLARYLNAKDKYEQGLQKVKDDAARAVQDRVRRNEALAAEIQRQEQAFRTDKAQFPLYDDDINARMEKIHEMTGGDKSPLAGHAWARTLYYYAALGGIQAGLLRKAQGVQKAAVIHAKKSAGSAAAVTAGAGAGSAAAGRTVKTNPNATWEKNIDAVGGRKVLNFSDA